MHLLVREARSLDSTDEAVDLGQSAAELLVLSFTDSDLAAVAKVYGPWKSALQGDAPSLRVASLQPLRHPGSVDLYVESVASRAKTIVVRLLGGLDYWRYGAEELGRIARERDIALAIIPGDGRADQRITELSTVSGAELQTISAYWDQGGRANITALLDLMAGLGGLRAASADAPRALPKVGYYRPELGACCPMNCWNTVDEDRPRVAVVFYRSLILADDLAAIDAVIAVLNARGLEPFPIFVNSLKDPETALWVERVLRAIKPGVILNGTAFSARRDDVERSALDVANVPVLQMVLSGSQEEAWADSERGLSAADLAMNVVLPELDGRVFGGAISFKAEVPTDESLQWPLMGHSPHLERVEALVSKVSKWLALARKDRSDRRIALVLSNYPGGGRAAHAVGLDGPASALAILSALRTAGYSIDDLPQTGKALIDVLAGPASNEVLPIKTYKDWLNSCPLNATKRVIEAWGAPEEDRCFTGSGLSFQVITSGNFVIAIQPDRGSSLERKDAYHDPDLPPRHGYLAFYAWAAQVFGMDAMIHLGTHGTLEWLPGKAVALSNTCYPELALAHVPVLYPFIVNNPGEAAAAKRRLSAVTIGHMTPPLSEIVITGPLAELERLVDDYAAADGLDKRRMSLLREEIVKLAREARLFEECGFSQDTDEDEALARLDAYLCDLKELQIRDGLHVFGKSDEAEAFSQTVDVLRQSTDLESNEVVRLLTESSSSEMNALLDGLDGRQIRPGPAGAPSRGRIDVLPTGRNLYTVDPRSVPTRTAYQIGKRAADEFIRRYMQDEGEAPKTVILDLWGSATMRTGGDELAQALALLGVRPIWDKGSNRVSGIEVMPLAELDYPRVDVTLRISGLFRDVFENQIKLFDEAVSAVSSLDESIDWNPLATAEPLTSRIFGAAPAAYGSGIGDYIAQGAWSDRSELGAAYIAQSGYAYGGGKSGVADHETFKARLGAADAHVQVRDHGEIDVLDRTTYGEFQGGAAAAANHSGGDMKLYQSDTSRPEALKVRTLQEELIRVVRGRAANPQWIRGQMRHGYAGAAEFANTLDALFAEAATTALPLSPQFDLYYDATLGDEEVDTFMRDLNPAARSAMAARFQEAIDRHLWQPRRNSVIAQLSNIQRLAKIHD